MRELDTSDVLADNIAVTMAAEEKRGEEEGREKVLDLIDVKKVSAWK